MGRAHWAARRIRCARKCRRGAGEIPRDNELSGRFVHDIFLRPKWELYTLLPKHRRIVVSLFRIDLLEWT
jgi:hypothetical protein